LSYQINFEPVGLRVLYREGATIFEAAREAGILLTSSCGGRNTCGKCKVRILEGDTTPIDKSERTHLSKEEINSGLRLACTAAVLSDLKVYIPQTSMIAAHCLELSSTEPALPIESVVTAYKIQMKGTALKEPQADWENLCKRLKERYGLGDLRPDPSLLPSLSPILRASGWDVVATERNGEIINVRPHGQRLLGMAIDLGTTKIAAYLIDLNTGENLATSGAINPQIAYGEDVMSRITCAMEGKNQVLSESVIKTINHLIKEASNNPEEVTEISVAGNTAMHHLLLDLPVKNLGRTPFLPTVKHSLDIKARDIGLQAAPGAYVHFLPNVAGFIGGDHVAMLLATGIYETNKTAIAIDVGTNTEISLVKQGILSSVSCASGPAFEGAGIKHGMRAAKGAIEGVEIGKDSNYLKVIGNISPLGICGSGILDAVYQLLKHFIIDQRGRLQDHPLVRQSSHGPEFILAPENTTGIGQDIVITQRDIGAIQLATAAIRAGINVLLSETGTMENEINEVIIAGAFGSYIDLASAIGLGMLPSISLARFHQVGNAAGLGAKLALISRKNRTAAEEIARRIQYIELTTHPKFKHEFSRSLQFPRPVPKHKRHHQATSR
jgi:uncharacterized 2Fe-2S/4Fe-4S cluster protein (DUF4445 family)